ncbi:MAG: ribH [Candidatus Taylorbacteria bacterium]|nr:ribH [Candidatus Taylorbacteria bacterium]
MQRGEQKKEIKKVKDLSKIKVALVVSEYNSDITFPMRDGAIEELKFHGVKESNVEVVYAPGAFEIPFLCQGFAKTKKYKGIIAIGCVIKGDTDHYYQISNESTRGIMDVMLKHDLPITNAILTVNNLEQAKIRSTGATNKGIEASLALLKVI